MENRFSKSSGLMVLILAVVGPPISALATFPAFQDSFRNPNEGPGVTNHPVGVRPSAAIRIPKGWPLSADGSLTCMTCHSTLPVGNNGANHLRGDGDFKNKSMAFYMNCHQDAGSGIAVHWQAMPMAHISLQHNRDVSGRFSHEDGSRNCLSCHDGVTARDAGHDSRQSMSNFIDRSRNHPVEMRYPFAGNAKGEVPLRPASSVPATVSLAGGVVSCVSCHNLYATDPQRLSLPIEGSQLCFACHDMD